MQAAKLALNLQPTTIHRYGVLAPGCFAPGAILNSARPYPAFAGGTLDYPSALTDSDLTTYQLVYLGRVVYASMPRVACSQPASIVVAQSDNVPASILCQLLRLSYRMAALARVLPVEHVALSRRILCVCAQSEAGFYQKTIADDLNDAIDDECELYRAK